jgi:signal transduction histidine kinase/DNA-binding response OmpR family regulator
MPTVQDTNLKPWRIIIIDDSPDDRVEIRRMLLSGSERWINFVEAGTAAMGIQEILNAESLPDCIVLDYTLPDMLAPDLLDTIRSDDGMPVCPVVVVTGTPNREHGRQVLRAGAQDYIGKDWTNPFALGRAVENACESWGMARELRQHKEASRLANEREKFRGLFSSETRDLTNEMGIILQASLLLGKQLNASRIMYGEVEADGAIVIGKSYVNGVEQINGRYQLVDFGSHLVSDLKSGKDVVVSNVQADGRYLESEKSAYAKLGIVANLGIPILKNGRLCAVMGVHQKQPRHWIADEIAMAREIGELTWTAVELARSEKKLADKEFQLTQMLQIMPSFSALLSGPTFVFEMANQSYFDLIGRGSEIIGKPAVEAIPEIADQPFPALLEAVYRTGEPFEAKAMAVQLSRGLSGQLIDSFVDFVYLPLRGADGNVASIFIHGIDRTAEVKANQLLLEQDLRKDEFLATLAHELRNPLAPIRNSFQLLKLAPSSEVIASTLPVMERQLGQLVRLIDDLLDVSRISSGKIVLKRQLISMQEIATLALETSQPLIDGANHVVHLDWPIEPVWVNADPTRMAQVFSNLLTNSAKYMKPGGQIEFSIIVQSDAVTVSVADHGLGIPPEMLGQVFDMFTQVSQSLERSEGGLGVGLSLVKSLVQTHGGTVQAFSQGVDLGSEFKVTLPLANKLNQPAIVRDEANSRTLKPQKNVLKGKRVLVVDDNMDAAQTFAMLLGLSDHVARVAYTGEQALAIAADFVPHIVFLDIGLPDMDGYEVGRKLLGTAATAGAKLIALTGWGTEADIQKTKAAGFHAHLTKPCDPEVIDELLLRLADCD